MTPAPQRVPPATSPRSAGGPFFGSVVFRIRDELLCRGDRGGTERGDPGIVRRALTREQLAPQTVQAARRRFRHERLVDARDPREVIAEQIE